MAVVASFTADVVAGASPLTVNFTDTSTGSPTHWLWDFGDGYTSSDQHPTHIYEDDGAYTVTLRAFISTGSSDIIASLGDGRLRNSSPPNWHSTNANAHAQLLINSWTPFSTGTTVSRYSVYRRDDLGGFTYFQAERDLSFDLTGFSSGIAVLMIPFLSTVNQQESALLFTSGNKMLPKTPFATLFFAEDVSSFIGSTFLTRPIDVNGGLIPLNDPTDGDVKGWGVDWPGAQPTVRVFTFSDEDTEIKTNFIVVGPPIANFSGTPLSGDNPLSVNFSDLSLGPVTSWSWRRRKSGSGDAFVEFSTSQNPTEIFDKTNP